MTLFTQALIPMWHKVLHRLVLFRRTPLSVTTKTTVQKSPPSRWSKMVEIRGRIPHHLRRTLTRVDSAVLETRIRGIRRQRQNIFHCATTDATFMAAKPDARSRVCRLGAVFIGGIRNDPAQWPSYYTLPKAGLSCFWALPCYQTAAWFKPRFARGMLFSKDSYDKQPLRRRCKTTTLQMQSLLSSRGTIKNE